MGGVGERVDPGVCHSLLHEVIDRARVQGGVADPVGLGHSPEQRPVADARQRRARSRRHALGSGSSPWAPGEDDEFSVLASLVGLRAGHRDHQPVGVLVHLVDRQRASPSGEARRRIPPAEGPGRDGRRGQARGAARALQCRSSGHASSTWNNCGGINGSAWSGGAPACLVDSVPDRHHPGGFCGLGVPTEPVGEPNGRESPAHGPDLGAVIGEKREVPGDGHVAGRQGFEALGPAPRRPLLPVAAFIPATCWPLGPLPRKRPRRTSGECLRRGTSACRWRPRLACVRVSRVDLHDRGCGPVDPALSAVEPARGRDR